MDQVERVARALSLNQRNRARMALGHDPVTDCGDSWKHWVDEARAAIEAMADPDTLRLALERIATSNIGDPNTPHPSMCAQIAREALTAHIKEEGK